MSILSDTNLREAMETGEIAMSPRPQKIEPASVDLTLGEVIKNSQTMARDISALAKDISALRETITTLTNRVNAYMAIFVSALVALVVGILVRLLVL